MSVKFLPTIFDFRLRFMPFTLTLYSNRVSFRFSFFKEFDTRNGGLELEWNREKPIIFSQLQVTS